MDPTRIRRGSRSGFRHHRAGIVGPFPARPPHVPGNLHCFVGHIDCYAVFPGACLVSCSSNEIYLGGRSVNGKEGCPGGAIADHFGYTIWVFKGVLVATLPSQGPADFVRTLILRKAHEIVCEVGVLGPVFPTEIMRQGPRGIFSLQIPNKILNRGVQVSRGKCIMRASRAFKRGRSQSENRRERKPRRSL